jgi:PAS domain S-box-containing protein
MDKRAQPTPSTAEDSGPRPDFQEIAENIPHTVWVTDHRGHNYYQSKSWYSYVGAGRESSSGEDWLQFYHPDDRARLGQEWARSRATQGDHAYDVQVRIRRWDREFQWFRVQGTPVRDADGSIRRWVGTCTNLEQSGVGPDRRSTRIGLFRWDLGLGIVTHENDALLRMLGRSSPFQGPWRESPLLQAMVRHSREAFHAALKAAIATGTPLRMRVQAQVYEGELSTIEASGVVEYDKRGKPSRFLGTAVEDGPVGSVATAAKNGSGLADWQIQRVITHMRDRLDAAVRLDDLARVVRLSPFHFSRAFKESTGLPPIRYLQAMRIDRARDLLGREHCSVQDIATAVGYDSAQALIRAFRNRFGTTPASYRRSSAAPPES